MRLKSLHQQRVEQFMLKAIQQIPDRPQTWVPEEVRRLRAKLILEEALETVKALGFRLSTGGVMVSGEFTLHDFEPFDLIEAVDGCCDVSVVTIGTLSALGVADVGPLLEVDLSNLAKFGPGGYRRDDGKWIKPPDHKPPDIKGQLVAQGGQFDV